MNYRNVELGTGCIIQENVRLGMPSREYLTQDETIWPKTEIGDAAIIRSGTIIYCDVVIGKQFMSGHHVLIREQTVIGDHVLVGTNSVIDGRTVIGSRVSIQTAVYLPTDTVIEDLVFLGPNVVMTNDRYPIRRPMKLQGPVVRKGATIGAHATILPGVEIGEGAVVAAGSVVVKPVPAWTLAVGVPARIRDLPEDLKTINKI